jgi:hypothetical protein
VVGVYGREYSKCTMLREQDGVFRLPFKVMIELRLFSARRLRVWRDVVAFTVTHGSESGPRSYSQHFKSLILCWEQDLLSWSKIRPFAVYTIFDVPTHCGDCKFPHCGASDSFTSDSSGKSIHSGMRHTNLITFFYNHSAKAKSQRAGSPHCKTK